ncbi:MAG: hypothetical protein IJZ42_05545 [Lachnospiraceae bacterium]|nr:hypothetical protein [Lachnospiraceae bacterium]
MIELRKEGELKQSNFRLKECKEYLLSDSFVRRQAKLNRIGKSSILFI